MMAPKSLSEEGARTRISIASKDIDDNNKTNSQMYNITEEMCALDNKIGIEESNPTTTYSSLDRCIDESYATELCSIASLVRSRTKTKKA